MQKEGLKPTELQRRESILQKKAAKISKDIDVSEPKWRYEYSGMNFCVYDNKSKTATVSLAEMYFSDHLGNIHDTSAHEIVHGLRIHNGFNHHPDFSLPTDRHAYELDLEAFTSEIVSTYVGMRYGLRGESPFLDVYRELDLARIFVKDKWDLNNQVIPQKYSHIINEDNFLVAYQVFNEGAMHIIDHVGRRLGVGLVHLYPDLNLKKVLSFDARKAGELLDPKFQLPNKVNDYDSLINYVSEVFLDR